MANTIDYDTRLKASSYVTFTSRYKTSDVVFYGDDRKTTFTTYKRTEITESETDTFSASPGISQFSLKTKNTAGQI